MRETLTIYHNPACTKSRETLALIRSRGHEPRVIEYLKTPPTARELGEIVGQLGIEAEALVRKGEDVYKTRYSGKQLTGAQWIAAMVKDPVLIERPIVVKNHKAVLGRPLERIEELLG